MLTVMDVRPSDVDKALSEFDFDRARELARAIDAESESAQLTDRVAAEESQALQAARDLHARITELARSHDYRDLLDIAREASTEGLLRLLPPNTKSRSEVHLKGAVRWAERQVEANRRRLDEVEKAVAELDIEFASGVLRRLDDGFMDGPMRDRRNQLLLDITARTIELEELQSNAARVIEEERPARWWQRRRRSR